MLFPAPFFEAARLVGVWVHPQRCSQTERQVTGPVTASAVVVHVTDLLESRWYHDLPSDLQPPKPALRLWDMKKGSSFEVDNGNGNNHGMMVDGAWYCCHTCWISIGQGPASFKVSRINWRRWWLDDGICKAKWHGEGRCVGLHSSLSGIPLDSISWKALFPIMLKHVLHLSSKFLKLVRFSEVIILVDPS